MDPINIALVAVIGILIILFMLHQEVLFGKMIRQNEKVMKDASERLNTLVEQNNKLLIHADLRLDRANEMVLTLAHSADRLAESINQIKDMAVERANLYEKESRCLMNNRDEYKEAYNKLLIQFEDQRKRLRMLADEDHRALKELASRPTTTNNNNNNLGE